MIDLQVWTEHDSVAICRKQQTEPVDLDHCLRAFTSEEKLEQCYHCAHCKSKQPATKKLQIWKLPPILIVHLKRFNYVNNKWVKSQKVVNFPFENFDPTPYLASVPQETILRHKELLEQHNNHHATTTPASPMGSSSELSSPNRSGRNIDFDHDHFNKDNNSTMTESIKERRIEEERDSNNSDFDDDDDEDGNGSGIDDDATNESSHKSNINNDINKIIRNSVSCSKRTPKRSIQQRKRLVSTSLTKTPIIDGALIDYHDHRLKDGQDPFDLKYKLYAVVVSVHPYIPITYCI